MALVCQLKSTCVIIQKRKVKQKQKKCQFVVRTHGPRVQRSFQTQNCPLFDHEMARLMNVAETRQFKLCELLACDGTSEGVFWMKAVNSS